MNVPLTAELFARAIIASAVSMGDLPPAIRSLEVAPKHLRPAALAVALEAKRPLVEMCRILEIGAAEVAEARRADKKTFRAAQDAAREAVAYHLKVKAERAAALGALAAEDADLIDAQVPAPSGAEPAVESSLSLTDETPAPRPAPSRPARKAAAKPAQTRAIPKGARVESLGEGVQVIRLKPITDSILRHARQQAQRGADVDELADLFGVDPDQLRRRLTKGEAA